MSTRIHPGQEFGRLEAIESLGRAGRGVALWRCSCSCGAKVHELSTDLLAGDVVSCGECPRGTRWTTAEDKLLREIYPNATNASVGARLDRSARAVQTRASLLGIEKSEAYMNSPACGRLQPGNVPPNKGKRGGPVHPNSRATQFKAGHRGWRYQEIGTEKLSDQGYRIRKVTDTGYPPRDWRYVHHLIWLEAGREIPESHALCFINGDRTDIRLDNLELVSRVDLMARNTRHRLPPEVNEIIALRARVTRKANRLERELDEKHDG